MMGKQIDEYEVQEALVIRQKQLLVKFHGYKEKNLQAVFNCVLSHDLKGLHGI